MQMNSNQNDPLDDDDEDDDHSTIIKPSSSKPSEIDENPPLSGLNPE